MNRINNGTTWHAMLDSNTCVLKIWQAKNTHKKKTAIY